MRKRLCVFLLIRTQVSILTFVLAFSDPAGAIASRYGSSAHRTGAHVTRNRKRGERDGYVRVGLRASRRRDSRSLREVQWGPSTEPAYPNSADGDNLLGEDMIVRRITQQALGDHYGSVVVVDSSTGRILSILNQKLALGDGLQPCSTFKVSVAMAALIEKVISPDDTVPVGRTNIDLTRALAHSNNYFFDQLGCKLGFEKVSYYAHQFGYGERASLNIDGEGSGHFPLAPPSNGGVGRLCSFGEEIAQTPLQLAALMGAIANGGILYSLQYPRNALDVGSFTPKVKRKLGIEKAISGITPGLREAVETGTARAARQPDPIAGKTGTCREGGTRLGWFGGFNSAGQKLVVVVLLTDGRGSGPRAAGVAGEVYRQLSAANYLAPPVALPAAVLPPVMLPPMGPVNVLPVWRLVRSDSILFIALILLFSSAIPILIWRMLRKKKGRTRFG